MVVAAAVGTTGGSHPTGVQRERISIQFNSIRLNPPTPTPLGGGCGHQEGRSRVPPEPLSGGGWSSQTPWGGTGVLPIAGALLPSFEGWAFVGAGDLHRRWAEWPHFLDLYIDLLGTFQEASEKGFCQPAREAQEAGM